jgi:hypothetical protein
MKDVEVVVREDDRGIKTHIVDFYILRAFLHKKPIPIVGAGSSGGGMTVIGTYKPRNPKTTLDEERKAAAAVASQGKA